MFNLFDAYLNYGMIDTYHVILSIQNKEYRTENLHISINAQEIASVPVRSTCFYLPTIVDVCRTQGCGHRQTHK